MARPLEFCVLLALLATSKGQECQGIGIKDSACPEPNSPHHEIVFPEDGRNICVPSASMNEGDTSIRTLVVTFSDRPNCVEVSGAQSVPLDSCSSGNATVHVDTRNLFGSVTETGEFDLVVDDQNTAVEYGPQGTHSVGPTSRTFSQSEPFQFVAWRSYFAGARTSKKLCVMRDNGNLKEPPAFINFEVVYKHENLSCVTAEVLTRNEKVLEYKIKKRSGVSMDPGVYPLVVANKLMNSESCEVASRESPAFTLTVEGTSITTTTPGPTLVSSPTKSPEGGSNVGIAIGVSFVALVIVLLVGVGIILLYVYWSRKRPRKTGDITDPPLRDETPMNPIDPDIKPPQPPAPEPKDSIVVVLDTVSSDLTLGYNLAKVENGCFEEFKTHEQEESEMWYIQRTNVILASDRYIRLYIIYRGSPEDLRKDHPHAWEVMKQIRTRAYDSNRLKKVVFVQVTSRTVSEGETENQTKMLDDHTVGIAEHQLSDSQLASIIASKMNIWESHGKTNNMTPYRSVAPEDQTDEAVSTHQSPQNSPVPHLGGRERTGDAMFLSHFENTSSGPPSYTSQPASQPSSLTLTQAGSVLIAQTTKESIQSSNSQTELLTEVKKLRLTQTQVLHELKEQRKVQEETAKNTGRTANNTEGLAEGMEEMRQTANETNDTLVRVNVNEEQPDNS